MPSKATTAKRQEDEFEQDDGDLRPEGGDVTAPERRYDRESQESVFDYLDSFGDVEFRAVLKRVHPKMYKNVKVNGTLEELDEPITEEEVKERHGGGKYQIIVRRQKRRKKGGVGWVFAGSKTFDVAGPPKLDSLVEPVEDDDAEADNTATSVVLKMARDLVQDARSGNNNGDMMELFERMSEKLSEKDARILEMLTSRSGGDDRFLALIEKSIDGEGNRISAIREQHASELRQLRDNYESQLTRLRDEAREDLKHQQRQHEHMLATMQAAHDREIATIRENNTILASTTQSSRDTQLEVVRGQLQERTAQLSEAKSEIATLRAKKELGPLEQLESVVKLKDGLGAVFGMGEKDEEPKGKLEKLLDLAMNSQLADRVADRFIPESQQQGQPQQGQPQQGQPGQPEEPVVHIRRPDGQVVAVPASVIARARAEKARREQEAADPLRAAGITEDELKMASQFMESAYRNGTDAPTFAKTARNSVPNGILLYLRKSGVDDFLNRVDVDPSSPLATVAGRNWIREVATSLLGGAN